SDIACTDCYIYGGDSIGTGESVGFSSAYSNPIIKNSYLYGGNTQSGASAALLMQDGNPQVQNCLIQGGTVSSTTANKGSSGIMIRRNTQPLISNCTITGGAANGGASYGIFITDNAKPVISANIRISGATVTSLNAAGSAGIVCASTSQPLITGNTI